MNISMSVSDFLADFTKRPKTAQVFAVEKDATFGQGQVFLIESVEQSQEDAVTLMCKSMVRRPIDEAFGNIVEALESGKPTKVFKTIVHKADDGKYQVSVDGRVVQALDTEAEAKLFAHGFVFGLEMGTAGKTAA
jgi:hypothetical protein